MSKGFLLFGAIAIIAVLVFILITLAFDVLLDSRLFCFFRVWLKNRKKSKEVRSCMSCIQVVASNDFLKEENLALQAKVECLKGMLLNPFRGFSEIKHDKKIRRRVSKKAAKRTKNR